MNHSDVYLVDDNEAFRSSTIWLLESAGFHVSDYSSGISLLDALQRDIPVAGASCLLSDVRMPDMSGLELQDALKEKTIPLPIIFVTAHGDVPLAVEAMRKGAVDFVEKPFGDDLIIQTIQRALAEFPKNSTGSGAANEKLATLTPRERQVLDLVVASKPNKLIAYALGISIKTVELHRANMMAKLGVRTLPDLMKLVLGCGD
jgi:FixJ family two-component response regulator